MPTKKEMLEGLTKAELEKLANKGGVDGVTTSMKKDEMVDALQRTTKVTKADIAG